MGLISVSGNFGFFNYCTAALSIVLLNDEQIIQIYGTSCTQHLFRRIDAAADVGNTSSVMSIVHVAAGTTAGMLTCLIMVPLLVVAVSCPLFQLGKSRRSTEKALSPLVEALHNLLQEFSVGNDYNLMARMTTVRSEIVLLGSVDGIAWKEYAWQCKPGRISDDGGGGGGGGGARRIASDDDAGLLNRLRSLGLRGIRSLSPQQLLAWLALLPVRLSHVGHIPRLDWRLSNKRMPLALLCGKVPQWFSNFVQRLLAGSPDVLALLGPDPFAIGGADGAKGADVSSTSMSSSRRPKFIKVQVYDYRFVGSQNVKEHFMPGLGELDWEQGSSAGWQRRFVQTVKTYESDTKF